MKRLRLLGTAGSVTALILGLAALHQIRLLNVAHSSFENYYAFRGCSQLLVRTDTYGICKTNSGSTIEIVKYEGKWYLDGDLPCKTGVCI